MFIAIDDLDNKVSIQEAEKGKNYYCPLCREKLIVKNNTKKIAAHFAHKPGSECVDWGDMSEWHLNWQEQFPKEYREVVLECNGIKHRADICIKEKHLVIEFQHSPISQEDFIKRTIFYTQLGYEMVWVFDAINKIKNPDDYTLMSNLMYKVHRKQDYNYQELEWKRRQDIFSNFDGLVRYCRPSKISVYLETEVTALPSQKVLFAITQQTNERTLWAWTTERYILREHFLRANFGYADN